VQFGLYVGDPARFVHFADPATAINSPSTELRATIPTTVDGLKTPPVATTSPSVSIGRLFIPAWADNAVVTSGRCQKVESNVPVGIEPRQAKTLPELTR
jgi:hypothetical protein